MPYILSISQHRAPPLLGERVGEKGSACGERHCQPLAFGFQQLQFSIGFSELSLAMEKLMSIPFRL
jgi:hypothetical protein